MTPAGSPLDVLSDHEHQATTGVEGTAYCARCEAVADVKELVEAAREAVEALNDTIANIVNDNEWSQADYDEWDAARRKAAEVLARFDRNQPVAPGRPATPTQDGASPEGNDGGPGATEVVRTVLGEQP